MRGIAALLVCASHLRNALLVDWGLAHDHGPLQQVLYGLTSLGHQSVMVFFVLSGYLVGGSVMSSGPRFDWQAYLIARLSRLWVVLWPCLALTYLIDNLTATLASDVLAGAFAERWHSAPVAGQYSTSWLTLLGNMAFVHTIAVPVFGSNGPLWSLANEFWYYVMFPLMMLSLGRVGRASMTYRVAYMALLAIVACWLPSSLLVGFLVWLMGAMVSMLQGRMQGALAPRWWAVPASLAFLAAIGVSKWASARDWAAPWGDLVLGLVFSACLLCALQLQAPGRGWRRAASLSRWLSDVSFSLYLSHFPLVILVSACLVHDASLQPSAASWCLFMVLLGGLIAIARLLWWLAERNTPTVRRFVTSQLGRVTQRGDMSAGELPGSTR